MSKNLERPSGPCATVWSDAANKYMDALEAELASARKHIEELSVAEAAHCDRIVKLVALVKEIVGNKWRAEFLGGAFLDSTAIGTRLAAILAPKEGADE